MKRSIETELLTWKQSVRRKPLIVRGARQIGKTYSIARFGEQHFPETAIVDLERNRKWHRVFEGDLDPQSIVSELELLTGKRIIPGQTLLFLDEIQSCPRAIMALRYFYEELPELHVIAAGSLLEFALPEISFPVGRIQFLEMYPISFSEYLRAKNNDQAAGIVSGRPAALPMSTHEMLLGELRNYCFIGGMPEAVNAYLSTGSLREAFAVHAEICETYRNDFPKYAPHADPTIIDTVFTNIALSVGQQIKYSRIGGRHSHTTAKRAFDLLSRAKVIKHIPSVSPAGLPLGARASTKRFKAILVDIGLWQYLSGMNFETEILQNDLLDVYRGAMAEQFVGQELLISQRGNLYYWSREARSSSAEVDYLARAGDGIYGVEVKSGSTGRLRSLKVLLDAYPSCRGGLVFSSAPYVAAGDSKILRLPLYYAGADVNPTDILAPTAGPGL